MLPIETVARYPLVGRFGLLARCMDRLMIPDDDAERSLRILDAWLATFAPDAEGRPAPYQVWALPGRDAFEGWLLARLDLLHQLGYPVRLANEEMDGVRGQQHMFVDGRRADLLLRFTADCDEGGGRRLAGPGEQDDGGRHRCARPARDVGGLAAGGVPPRRRARHAHRRRAQPRGRARAARAPLRLPVDDGASATAAGCASTRRSTRSRRATRRRSTTHRTCRCAPWRLRSAERSPYRRRPPPVPHDWRGLLSPSRHLSRSTVHIRLCRGASRRS